MYEGKIIKNLIIMTITLLDFTTASPSIYRQIINSNVTLIVDATDAFNNNLKEKSDIFMVMVMMFLPIMHLLTN